MSRQGRRGKYVPRGWGKDRRITVRAVRRNPPDIRKFSEAVVAFALAQSEADAQAEAATRADNVQFDEQAPELTPGDRNDSEPDNDVDSESGATR